MCLGISVRGDDVGVFPGGSRGCVRVLAAWQSCTSNQPPPNQLGVGNPRCSTANTDLTDPLKFSGFFFHRWIATALLAEERRGDLQNAAFRMGRKANVAFQPCSSFCTWLYWHLLHSGAAGYAVLGEGFSPGRQHCAGVHQETRADLLLKSLTVAAAGNRRQGSSGPRQ